MADSKMVDNGELMGAVIEAFEKQLDKEYTSSVGL